MHFFLCIDACVVYKEPHIILINSASEFFEPTEWTHCFVVESEVSNYMVKFLLRIFVP